MSPRPMSTQSKCQSERSRRWLGAVPEYSRLQRVADDGWRKEDRDNADGLPDLLNSSAEVLESSRLGAGDRGAGDVSPAGAWQGRVRDRTSRIMGAMPWSVTVGRRGRRHAGAPSIRAVTAIPSPAAPSTLRLTRRPPVPRPQASNYLTRAVSLGSALSLWEAPRVLGRWRRNVQGSICRT